jgi:protein SCO1/2
MRALLWLLAGCAPEPALVPVAPVAVAPVQAPVEKPAPLADPVAFALPPAPDIALVDQDGAPARLAELLAGDKPIALQFIFTSCGMTCPLMGAGFGGLQALAPDTRLVSISIDPQRDTPEALRAWGERFGRKPGWTLLTGSRNDVEALLRAWQLYTPVISEHAPVVLIGRGGRWFRANGLAPARDLLAVARRLDAPVNEEARAWFTDTVLVDQDGRSWRFYADLVQGRSVVINGFYSTCKGSCPAVNGNLQRVALSLADRMGPDVELLSISLDPSLDTPEKLKTYAEGFGSPRGWRFLTGPREDVERVLKKLGLYTENIEAHAPIVLVGNDRTGLWKKALGFSDPLELATTVLSVVDDPGPVP